MTKFERIERRLQELVQDYGKMSMKKLQDKYGASYATIQRVLKRNNYIQGNKNYKYLYIREHIEDFKKDYTEGILTENELAEKYKCPITCYYSIAQDLGLNRKKLRDKLDILEILEDWDSKEMGSLKICEKYGISFKTLKSIIRENKENVPNRYGRKDFFNDCYFDDITDEHKAYWLGFIYADGSHNEKRYSLTISLKESDESHLWKFVKDIESNKQVRKYLNKNFNRYFVNVSVQHPHLSETLMKKGVPSDKSFKIKFPSEEIVPHELKWHFIRGYFDGDGCISINSSGISKASICIAGNEDFLVGMKEFIENEIPDYIINIHKHKNIYIISKGGRLVIEKMLDKMYENATIYLDRKYEKYNELIQYKLLKEEVTI